jgi:hypothetical protein
MSDGPGGDDAAGQERLFTRDEADALLPSLIGTIVVIRDARHVVLSHGTRIRDAAVGNGGGGPGKEYLEALAAVRRGLEELSRAGVILRDPETGLVDFPARREGHEIFLCWRMGEARVSHWHGMEAGFAGRRPLE